MAVGDVVLIDLEWSADLHVIIFLEYMFEKSDGKKNYPPMTS